MAGYRRRLVPILAIVGGLLLAAATVAVVLPRGDDGAPNASGTAAVQAGYRGVEEVIYRAQLKLRSTPQDALTWAQLGSAYVEQARITADPAFYTKAQGALERSMQLAPTGNAEAMIGLGLLANARHDFAAARSWGEQARALRPSSPEVYGVLADALTQLGDADGATAVIQSMLDVRPGVASFTRASYDLELHGRVDEARSALEQALGAAVSPDDVAFCRFYLGELAFNSGRLDEAAAQYEQGLAAAPGNVALLGGRAKLAAATGRTEEAVAGYAEITARVPLQQYVLEYAELLESAGRLPEARAQFELLAAQQRLYAALGSVDDLVASQGAAAAGDPAEALRRAQAEWGRRQSVFTADGLAWALHVNGRDAEALPYAERAGALGWRNAAFTYHRGMILKALGRNAEALTVLSEALTINPSFSPLHVPRARQALAELGGPP